MGIFLLNILEEINLYYGRIKKTLGTKSRPPYAPSTWLCSWMSCAENVYYGMGRWIPSISEALLLHREKLVLVFPFCLSIQVPFYTFYRDFLGWGYWLNVYVCIWSSVVLTWWTETAWQSCVHTSHTAPWKWLESCSLGFLPSHLMGCVERSGIWSHCCIILFCSWGMAVVSEGVKCWHANGCREAAVPQSLPHYLFP